MLKVTSIIAIMPLNVKQTHALAHWGVGMVQFHKKIPKIQERRKERKGKGKEREKERIQQYVPIISKYAFLVEKASVGKKRKRKRKKEKEK